MDVLGHDDGGSDVALLFHEAAQLHGALESLDVDLRGLEAGFGEDGRLHLGGDDAVVDVFAGAFAGGGRTAAEGGGEREGSQEAGNDVGLVHFISPVSGV